MEDIEWKLGERDVDLQWLWYAQRKNGRKEGFLSRGEASWPLWALKGQASRAVSPASLSTAIGEIVGLHCTPR